MSEIEIGRLLRAGINGYVVGTRLSTASTPAFGSLVRAPLGETYQIYGLIYDIHVDDDGLVQQLVTSERVDAAIIEDNRVNRNVPMEMSVLSVGYREGDQIWHLLPPRAPLSLDAIYLCGDEDVYRFTRSGHFGYFRHILRARDLPVGELLAAHIKQAQEVHLRQGNPDWASQATQALITLLRDDYATLMGVLSAIADCRLALVGW
jgi:hypothetical protein